MSIIGYYKDYNYVVTIRANEYTSFSKTVINPETALYKTGNYEILKIEDIIENEIEDPTFRIKKLVFFYINKELAIFDKFIEYEEYKIFPLGYSGVYCEYHENGNLYKKFYHINVESRSSRRVSKVRKVKEGGRKLYVEDEDEETVTDDVAVIRVSSSIKSLN